MANLISEQSKAEALKIAKGTQKPGQTKEQTKLISQGIEKGIAEYKKQQKAKARDADKQRKQTVKEKQRAKESLIEPEIEIEAINKTAIYLPWFLLISSWVGFAFYFFRANA